MTKEQKRLYSTLIGNIVNGNYNIASEQLTTIVHEKVSEKVRKACKAPIFPKKVTQTNK